MVSPSNPLGKEVSFSVGEGETASTVSTRLMEMGLINDSNSFRDYLIYSGIETNIQAGDFILNPAMKPLDIASKLQNTTSTQVDFVILAGWRAEEIAESLPTSGLEIKSDEFLMVIERREAEGYMLPGVYTLQRDIKAESLVEVLIDSFQRNLTDELRSGFKTQGLSIEEAATLASIVEKEVVIDGEMPLVASVFLNRLNSGMVLAADPTVQYALGFNQSQQTWWTNPLSSSNLSINSPYNTYLNPGLPPGPICNPSRQALKAVAFPAETPYYYFRADCDNSGRHLFAETLEEHIENACP